MGSLFEQYAEKYALEMECTVNREEPQRFVRNPIVFVFIGDKCQEAFEEIFAKVNREWDNGKAVMFLRVSSKEFVDSENVFNISINYDSGDIKKVRKNIYENFYLEDYCILELNRKIVSLKNKLLECGNLYAGMEKVNIAVVTRADDCTNVLVPEITLLMKQKLSQHFLITAADLYTLLLEKNENEQQFINGVLSVSFLKEMKHFQSSRFKFDKKIEAFDKERKLAVCWDKPLFELVYVLSDTNKNGLVIKESLKENYNIIFYICLIKNKGINSENYFDIKNNLYDDLRYKRSISEEDGGLTLTTAGLSVIKKPDALVAMTVLSYVFKDFLTVLKNKLNAQKIFYELKIDDYSLNKRVNELLPRVAAIKDIDGIAVAGIRSNKLSLGICTLSELEKACYGDSCERFFRDNFINISEESFRAIKVGKLVEEALERIFFNVHMGIYCARFCTEEQGIIKLLIEKVSYYESNLERLEEELEKEYEKTIDKLPVLGGLFNRALVNNEIKNKLINEVYSRRLNIHIIKLKIALLKEYISELRKRNDYYQEKAIKLDNLEKSMDKQLEEALKAQDNYLTQNIRPYYSQLTKNKLSKLVELYGDNFYFAENFVDNPAVFLKGDIGGLVKKLEHICDKYILCESEFKLCYEDELRERISLDIVNYDNKLATRNEIYKQLCAILEEKAVPKAFIIDYNVKKHEEKYFFGDYSSDFIKYVYNFDKEWRGYAIGYVHERKAMGIAKLSFLGGFKVEDIVYYKNSLKYYEACEKDGYLLHGIDLKG